MASFHTCECCGHEHDTRLSHRCHPLDVTKVNTELRTRLAEAETVIKDQGTAVKHWESRAKELEEDKATAAATAVDAHRYVTSLHTRAETAEADRDRLQGIADLRSSALDAALKQVEDERARAEDAEAALARAHEDIARSIGGGRR